MNSWPTFFAAELDASAALTGLVVVAISVNLGRILETPHLPGRAAEALVILGSVLVAASLALVPGQTLAALGAEVLALGVASFATTMAIQLRALGGLNYGTVRRTARMALAAFVSLPMVAAGAVLLAGVAWGFYLIAGGVVLSLVAGLIAAWVLLIEIAR